MGDLSVTPATIPLHVPPLRYLLTGALIEGDVDSGEDGIPPLIYPQWPCCCAAAASVLLAQLFVSYCQLFVNSTTLMLVVLVVLVVVMVPRPAFSAHHPLTHRQVHGK